MQRGEVMSDLEKYKRYAKRIAIFKGLTPEEISEIIHQGRATHFQQGKIIFHKGQLGRSIFIVFSGTVEILDGDRRVTTCRLGDAFGEMSALDHRPHSATAVAATDVRLFTLDEDDINNILEQHVAVRFLLNIIHLLSVHVAETNTRVTRLERWANSAKVPQLHAANRGDS